MPGLFPPIRNGRGIVSPRSLLFQTVPSLVLLCFGEAVGHLEIVGYKSDSLLEKRVNNDLTAAANLVEEPAIQERNSMTIDSVVSRAFVMPLMSPAFPGD